MGNYSSALSSYITALAIREEVLPPIHVDLAAFFNNIGVLYHSIVTSNDHIAAVHHDMNNCATAFFYYEETLPIRQASVLPTHPDLATSYHNIGWIYRNKKNYWEVLASYQKVLKIRLTSLFPAHPHLALFYDNIGDHRKVLDRYNQVLAIR
ncbi:unnamed protein product [Adineta ricciae]|uniref:Uncharacterized protein n=1 Tax=Adineta ricciae TaxID=249248 RepID=A0A814EC34_ADIRI|nr:unnamed protein product [Adineta ricciae]